MNTINIAEIVSNHDLFRDLDPNYITLLERAAAIKHYNHHDHIFYQGRRCDKFYMVVEGSVAIQLYAGEDGFMTLDTLGPGAILGWSWLLPPYEWVFTGEAATSLIAIMFDGIYLRQRCDEDNRFGYEMAKRLSMVTTERLLKTRAALVQYLAD